MPVPDSAYTYSESKRLNNNDNEEMNICRRKRDLPVTSSAADLGKLGKDRVITEEGAEFKTFQKLSSEPTVALTQYVQHYSCGYFNMELL